MRNVVNIYIAGLVLSWQILPLFIVYILYRNHIITYFICCCVLRQRLLVFIVYNFFIAITLSLILFVVVCFGVYITVTSSTSRYRIGRGSRFGKGASLYRHRSQLFGRLWVRLPLPTGQFSSIFIYRPILSSPYCATRNKGVRLLSLLKLWPITERSVMSENNDC